MAPSPDGVEVGTAMLLRRVDALVRHRRLVVSLVFALALMVRLGFVLGTPRGGPAYDELLYDALARNVLEGVGYRLDGYDAPVHEAYREGPTAIMAPGYPAFLMAVYAVVGPEASTLPVRLLQALIGAASCALVCGVVYTWRLGPRTDRVVPYVALVAGLLAAVSRVLVGHANLLLSENLAVPLVLLAALLLLRPPTRRAAVHVSAVAVTLALAVHVRSELVIVVPVAVLWVGLVGPRLRDLPPAVHRWRAVDAVWIAAVFVLLLVPWTARNVHQLGGFAFVRSFSGPVMFYANNDSLRSIWAMAHGETARLPAEVEALPPGDELALDRYLRGEAMAFMRAHPDRVARAAVLKSVEFWRPIPDPWRIPGELPNRVLTGVMAWWLSIAGIVVSLRRPRRSSLVLGVLLVEALFVALFASWERERFRTPVYPFELMLTAAGLVWLGVAARDVVSAARDRRLADLSPQTKGLAGIVVVLALVFAALAHRDEPVAAFSPLDRPADLAAWESLQGTAETVAIDEADAARWPGSLRVTSRPEAGWQDLQLPIPAGSYDPNGVYRIDFWGRTDGRGGGQVYPLLPASPDHPRTVGLHRYIFTESSWHPHRHYFFAPFDNEQPLAIYVSHADYEVPDASIWIDDLTVRRSGWVRLVWDGYVRGAW